MYLLPHYQLLVGRLRLFCLVKVRKQLKCSESDRAFATTSEHNLKSLRQFNRQPTCAGSI
jgi:hypothetical protein